MITGSGGGGQHKAFSEDGVSASADALWWHDQTFQIWKILPRAGQTFKPPPVRWVWQTHTPLPPLFKCCLLRPSQPTTSYQFPGRWVMVTQEHREKNTRQKLCKLHFLVQNRLGVAVVWTHSDCPFVLNGTHKLRSQKGPSQAPGAAPALASFKSSDLPGLWSRNPARNVTLTGTPLFFLSSQGLLFQRFLLLYLILASQGSILWQRACETRLNRNQSCCRLTDKPPWKTANPGRSFDNRVWSWKQRAREPISPPSTKMGLWAVYTNLRTVSIHPMDIHLQIILPRLLIGSGSAAL